MALPLRIVHRCVGDHRVVLDRLEQPFDIALDSLVAIVRLGEIREIARTPPLDLGQKDRVQRRIVLRERQTASCCSRSIAGPTWVRNRSIAALTDGSAA